jgi:hypothetical protein
MGDGWPLVIGATRRDKDGDILMMRYHPQFGIIMLDVLTD